MLLSLLFENPVLYVMVIAAVMGSIVLHELGHALAASWEGDPTPKIRGHFTWNPVVHMGWLSIGLLLVFGIAFGRTPVTPARFRHRRWGEAIVAFAGPAVNLGLALLGALMFGLIARLGLFHDEAGQVGLATQFWFTVLSLNVALFLLNLIPLPPLDGFTILEGAVDLGELGPMLRRLGMIPVVVAFLIFQSDAFSALRTEVTRGLVGAAAALLRP